MHAACLRQTQANPAVVVWLDSLNADEHRRRRRVLGLAWALKLRMASWLGSWQHGLLEHTPRPGLTFQYMSIVGESC